MPSIISTANIKIFKNRINNMTVEIILIKRLFGRHCLEMRTPKMC